MSSIEHLTYKITSDNDLLYERYGITRELSGQFEDLHARALNRNDNTIIDRLTNLVIKFPNSPQLKNFLSVAYNIRGNRQKAREINDRTLTEHPDYLFGKLNLAISFMDKKEYEKVPEILGEMLEINNLYPDRDEFHIGEVSAFYKMAVYYFTAIKNLELAENRFQILVDFDPNHPDTIDAASFIDALKMERVNEKHEENRRSAIKVRQLIPIPESLKTGAPIFNHPEINELYLLGLDLPREKIDKILSCPRDTIIADLEKLLQDGIERFLFFEEKELFESLPSFPLHAICFLGELKAEKSLPAVLNFLSQHPDLLDFWFGDHLNETIWQPVYRLSVNQPELLKEFCLKPGVDPFAKTVASETLAQIAFHNPARSSEIALIFKDILQVFVKVTVKDNIIDSEFLGLCIADILDCGFKELLPEIKTLYAKGYFNDEVNGPIEEIVDIFDEPGDPTYRRNLEDIYGLYDNINQNWVEYAEDPDEDWDDALWGVKNSPVTVVKIGRNDPCPCGSGKKYKKCCIDKFQL
jgi:tetratricopeptide (TPR) repeat protein